MTVWFPDPSAATRPAEERPGAAFLGKRLRSIANWSSDHVSALSAILVTLALLIIVPRPLCGDVSGQLWIAHHMRLGARLYVDISEINPPLWFWMAMPIDWAARSEDRRYWPKSRWPDRHGLTCLPPRRIIFFQPDAIEPKATPTRDSISYFLRDPGFAALMRHCRYWARSGDFAAYALETPMASVPAAQCQRGM